METVRNGLEGADRQLVTYVGVCTSAVALLSSCHAVSSACSRTDIQCLRIVRVISPIRVVSILTVGARALLFTCLHTEYDEVERAQSTQVQRAATERAASRRMFNFVPLQLHADEKCRERIYVVCIAHPLF